MTQQPHDSYIDYEDGKRVMLGPDDCPELDAEWFRNAKSFSDLPAELQATLRDIQARRVGRPRVEKPKERVTIRFDHDVAAALRSKGKGWQTQLNAFLRAAMLEHRL